MRIDFAATKPAIGQPFKMWGLNDEIYYGRFEPRDTDNGLGVYGVYGTIFPVSWEPITQEELDAVIAARQKDLIEGLRAIVEKTMGAA